MITRIQWQAAVWRPLRQRLGASVLAIIGIALGVALGLAIALINIQAVSDFSSGLRRLSGQADLALTAPGRGFPEHWYVRLSMSRGVAVAAPEIRLLAPVLHPAHKGMLHILGIDAFQAARMGQPLLPFDRHNPLAMLAPDHIALSPAALAHLGLRVGDTLTLNADGQPRTLRIIGELPGVGGSGAFGVMDIAAVQWLWGRVGTLNQVDLRLHPGTGIGDFLAQWRDHLPVGAVLQSPAQQGRVAADASRAYRVNLLVLSLVALFTGAFLVYSTLAMGVVRQRQQLALLRVLGLRRREIVLTVLLQGAVLGLPGALLGLPLGVLAAWLALARMGGDLGAGYFSATALHLQWHPGLMLIFFVAGLGAALTGAFLPAWESSRATPALALRAGTEEQASQQHQHPWIGLLLLGLALAGSLAPAIHGIPYLAYGAVACLLFALLFLLAPLLRGLTRLFPLPHAPVWRLALEQLRGAPGRAAQSLAAVVVAFSLVVAMAVMVGSFRDSVANWLTDILRADLYVQAGMNRDSFLPHGAAHQLCALPAVRACSPLRRVTLNLLPGHPPVMLLARGMNISDPERELQILHAVSVRPQQPPPVWISEVLAGLSGWQAGRVIHLPLGGQERVVTIAGIYRDYAYQEGSVSIPIQQYRAWSGDDAVNGVALWLRPGAAIPAAIRNLRQTLPDGGRLLVATPKEIRSKSLQIFNQSFAATYALEAVAMVIGLLGVSSGFGAQTLMRRNEYAMLRHLGLRRRDLRILLFAEGSILSLLGILIGGALGMAISVILIEVVNPQSFHWHMGFHPSWPLLLTLSAILWLASTATMVLAGQRVIRQTAAVLHDD
ncbi:ABC transporter permease [Acidithiobacillus ferrivorans]|uniref:ABC transporter permease n=1 Tax=Acidithiobacillus ferrivorans TaxID=160808 RepID=A0A1B9BYE7_9PROT|nr:FtsX-like permease family protein [Acidithiobacillus ferrivorans]OCB02728.1 ABC transporter permease [Acidithiobacillus ferrivorans]